MRSCSTDADLLWPADEQVTALFFPDKSGTISLTPEGWKAWLVVLEIQIKNPESSARDSRHFLRVSYHALSPFNSNQYYQPLTAEDACDVGSMQVGQL